MRVLEELETLEDDDVEKTRPPASASPVARLVQLERELPGIVERLSRRLRKMRRVLVEIDGHLEDVQLRLDREENRAHRLPALDVEARRGLLFLVDGDDGYLYVGRGAGVPTARIALEELP